MKYFSAMYGSEYKSSTQNEKMKLSKKFSRRNFTGMFRLIQCHPGY